MRGQSLMLAVVLMAYLTQGCGATGNNNPIIYPELKGYTPSSGLPSRPIEDGVPFRYVVYVPYVEEAIIPSHIYEETPFEIILKVSALRRPPVLYGLPSQREARMNVASGDWALDPDLLVDGRDSVVPIPMDVTDGAFLPTTVRNPLGVGPPIDEFVYRIQGLTAGKCRLAYYTTTEASFGGIGWFVETHELSRPFPGDPVDWIDQYVEKREIIIEVLPRETGSSS